MTGWYFTANGPLPGYAPTGSGGTGPWLLPAVSHEARSYQSWGSLVGQPGTQWIPAPDPAAIPPCGNLPTMARGNTAWALRDRSSSRDAPNAWLPALYYQRPMAQDADATLPNTGTNERGIGLGPIVSWVSDNQLPIPAIDPRGKPAIMAQRPPRIGGRGQVAQPYYPVSWPKWHQTNPQAPLL